jgi:transcription elongation factor SPT6
MNCAGFIKIDTARIDDKTDTYIEVLDSSRIHPETYECVTIDSNCVKINVCF